MELPLSFLWKLKEKTEPKNAPYSLAQNWHFLAEPFSRQHCYCKSREGKVNIAHENAGKYQVLKFTSQKVQKQGEKLQVPPGQSVEFHLKEQELVGMVFESGQGTYSLNLEEGKMVLRWCVSRDGLHWEVLDWQAAEQAAVRQSLQAFISLVQDDVKVLPDLKEWAKMAGETALDVSVKVGASSLVLSALCYGLGFFSQNPQVNPLDVWAGPSASMPQFAFGSKERIKMHELKLQTAETRQKIEASESQSAGDIQLLRENLDRNNKPELKSIENYWLTEDNAGMFTAASNALLLGNSALEVFPQFLSRLNIDKKVQEAFLRQFRHAVNSNEEAQFLLRFFMRHEGRSQFDLTDYNQLTGRRAVSYGQMAEELAANNWELPGGEISLVSSVDLLKNGDIVFAWDQATPRAEMPRYTVVGRGEDENGESVVYFYGYDSAVKKVRLFKVTDANLSAFLGLKPESTGLRLSLRTLSAEP